MLLAKQQHNKKKRKQQLPEKTLTSENYGAPHPWREKRIGAERVNDISQTRNHDKHKQVNISDCSTLA